MALFTRIFEYLDRSHEIENPEKGMRVFARGDGPGATPDGKGYDELKKNPDSISQGRGFYEYNGSTWVKIASAD